LKNVTPADVQRVAQKYLTPENRTLYALLPEGFAPTSLGVTETNTAREIEKFVLPNGLTLLVKEDHRLPFVEFRAIFQGGVLAESPANNGITQLLSKLLLKGTQRRTAEGLAIEIESIGGSIDSYGGNQSFGVNVEVLSSDFAVGLDLLADVLLNPTFPADALEREREVQIAGIHAVKDELLKSASLAMRRAIFGEATFGLDPLGTEAVVAGISTDDLRAFHRKLATPNNCVMAIYGDVRVAEVRAAVDNYFADWQASPVRPGYADLSIDLREAKRVTEFRDKKQAVLVIGFQGTTMNSDDRFALELIQESCSDLGSRLFLRIREELGLAYYVGAQNFAGIVPGYFAFYTGTEPSKAEQVETELLREAELLRTEGLTAEELKRTKAKIIGQKKISRQDLGHLASATALDELYGLGYGRAELDDAKYEAVTLEDIKRVAQKYLKPDALVVSVVMPEK
jgi:zinc protease